MAATWICLLTYSAQSGNRDESFRSAVSANATVADVTLESFKTLSTTSTTSDSVTCCSEKKHQSV
jgi:hypothetical protein